MPFDHYTSDGAENQAERFIPFNVTDFVGASSLTMFGVKSDVSKLETEITMLRLENTTLRLEKEHLEMENKELREAIPDAEILYKDSSLSSDNCI